MGLIGEQIKRWKFARTRKPRERLDGTVHWDGEKAVVAAGTRSFFLKAANHRPATSDWALYGQAIISMSKNIEIDVRQPVTHEAFAAFEQLKRVTDTLSFPGVAPLRLNFHKVVASPARPAKPKGKRLLCMSGGVDSTAAAIRGLDDGSYSHGMLIAGADYPSAEHPGFMELRPRVRRIAENLGIGLLEVETDIRRMGMNYEMLHGFMLAMCLHFFDASFTGAGIATDTTPYQDFISHPWGTSSTLTPFLGTALFPIEPLMGDLDRVQKSGMVALHPGGLLKDISICYEDISTGGNCGVCGKCVRTRLAFACHGIDARGIFVKAPPLEQALAGVPVSPQPAIARLQHIRMLELCWHMPEGPLREQILAYAEKAAIKSRF